MFYVVCSCTRFSAHLPLTGKNLNRDEAVGAWSSQQINLQKFDFLRPAQIVHRRSFRLQATYPNLKKVVYHKM
jgi:hypothetical protein